MRVLVLGGDGFCGWPTSLYLSARGHDVTILDNLSRRKIDVDLEVQSLTPIRPIGERLHRDAEAFLRKQICGRVQQHTTSLFGRQVAFPLPAR